MLLLQGTATLDWGMTVLAIIGGSIAGFMNTLAGNGSTITLYLCMEVLGLPANVANGSNRVGILAMSLSALPTFYKKNKSALTRSKPIVALLFVGAMLGLLTALWVDNAHFKFIFKFLLVLTLIVLLVNPKQWLRQTDDAHALSWWISIPLFLGIGFYGGFIQMGMGIFFLMAMVLGAKYSLTDANATKLVGVGLYTFVGVIMFAYSGLIHWPIALALAVGQAIGGNLAARFATQNEKANVWTHRLLITVILFAIIRIFFF